MIRPSLDAVHGEALGARVRGPSLPRRCLRVALVLSASPVMAAALLAWLLLREPAGEGVDDVE